MPTINIQTETFAAIGTEPLGEIEMTNLSTSEMIPTKFIGGGPRTAWRSGYDAAVKGKDAQVYGGKITKEAYLAGYKAGTEAEIAMLEAR
jgi:hypothetical protein